MTGLRLEPFVTDYAGAFHEAVRESTAELVPWMPWCHEGYTLDEAASWMKFQSEQFAARKTFEFLLFDRDRLIGPIGITRVDEINKAGNIGYWMRSFAARNGYATAALKMLIAWAAANTDLHRLEILIATDNIASLRVAEKAGARREAVLRERLLLQGRFHDAVMFAMIRGRDL